MMLQGIVHDADRMDTILRMLVDAARVVGGTLEVFREQVDVGDLVRWPRPSDGIPTIRGWSGSARCRRSSPIPPGSRRPSRRSAVRSYGGGARDRSSSTPRCGAPRSCSVPRGRSRISPTTRPTGCSSLDGRERGPAARSACSSRGASPRPKVGAAGARSRTAVSCSTSSPGRTGHAVGLNLEHVGLQPAGRLWPLMDPEEMLRSLEVERDRGLGLIEAAATPEQLEAAQVEAMGRRSPFSAIQRSLGPCPPRTASAWAEPRTRCGPRCRPRSLPAERPSSGWPKTPCSMPTGSTCHCPDGRRAWGRSTP